MKSYSFIFLFITAALFIYWPGRIGYPRADHINFLREADHAIHNWDFFVRSVFFNRMRVIAPGDYFLFRPLTTSLLGLIDIFARHKMELIGITSIVLHGCVTSLIFLILKRSAGIILAVLFTTLHLFQYSGIELFYWRHIFPYIFSILFFLGAALIDRSEVQRKKYVPEIFFFVACLFHEMAALSLIFLLIAQFFIKKTGVLSHAKRYAIPLGIFLVLNIADYIIHSPPSFLGAKEALEWRRLKIIPSVFFGYSGVNTISFFWPTLIELKTDMVRGLLTWNFLNLYSLTVWSVLGLLAWMIPVFGWKLCRGTSNQQREFRYWLLFGTAVFLSIVASVGVFRGALRGVYYFQYSTYYFYFTGVALTLVFAMICAALLKRFEKTHIRSIILYSIGFWIVVCSLQNYKEIRRILYTTSEAEVNVAAIVSNVISKLETDPVSCIDKFEGDFWTKTRTNMILGRFTCARRAGRPVTLQENDYSI